MLEELGATVRATHTTACSQPPACQAAQRGSSGDIEDKTLLSERMIHTYEEQTGKIFAEDLRVGVWQSNAPESALKTHMLMRTELVQWADIGAEMISCSRALKASRGMSPSPMDIGAFAKGKNGDCKGKKGDDKGKQPPKDAATCWKCGKTGHSPGQRLSDHTCSKCGKKGHRAEKCWSKASSASGAGSPSSNSEGDTGRQKYFACGKKLATSRRLAPTSGRRLWQPSKMQIYQQSALSLSLPRSDDDFFGSYMLGCVEPDLGVWSFMKTPEVSYLTIDTGASRTVFPRSWAPSVHPPTSGELKDVLGHSTGLPLDSQKVIVARREEMDFMTQLGVTIPSSLQECHD